MEIKEYFENKIAALGRMEKKPSLLIIDGTEGDAANQIYIRNKVRDFTRLGWQADVIKVTTDKELEEACKGIGYDGVIAQMPLRKDFTVDVRRTIPREKDCDGLTIDSKVRPATVRGILDFLDWKEFEFSGKTATVLGRSEIVGKPMAEALLERNMTVIQCHSKTSERIRDEALGMADLIISAVGKPKFFSRRQISDNAVVIDVGINKTDNGLVGDFEEIPYFCGPKGWSTPVPGGVGLLTRLGLLENLISLKAD